MVIPFIMTILYSEQRRQSGQFIFLITVNFLYIHNLDMFPQFFRLSALVLYSFPNILLQKNQVGIYLITLNILPFFLLIF